MKNGKVSESVLKRSILKQLHSENEHVLLGPAVGEDAAAVRIADGQLAIFSSALVDVPVSELSTLAKLVVVRCINNVVCSGAQPLGIMVDVLVPTLWNEAGLRQLMKEIDRCAKEEGVQVIGGHTQVTRAVKEVLVTASGIGKVAEHSWIKNSSVKPGMDIIVTKWIGLEGTALLAMEKAEELGQRYAAPFIDKAKQYIDYLSIQSEAAVAGQSGAAGMHDVSDGGIFGALWEMAEASGVGLEIYLKKIPIRQETVEISEFFDINPYKLAGTGSLIIIAEDGNKIVREIEKAGGKATIVGHTTDSNDRVLIQGQERRFLETAQTDELLKIMR